MAVLFRSVVWMALMTVFGLKTILATTEFDTVINGNCPVGYYGDNCNQRCPAHCSKNCSTTGSCIKCDDGYYKTSANCENKCYLNNCATCIHLGNNPFPEFCKKCFEGYYGTQCQYRCADNCEKDSCKRLLHNLPCKCKDGWFGSNCSRQCPQHCKSCHDDSTCIECHGGFHGSTCTETCAPGCDVCSIDGQSCLRCNDYTNTFGDSCQCKTDQCATKDSNGQCSSCKQDDWYTSGSGCCPCSQHCNSGCNEQNGLCVGGCTGNFYGDKCQFDEPRKCSQFSSSNKCLDKCETGWAGSYCNMNCSVFLPHCKSCYASVSRPNTLFCKECEGGYFAKFTVSGGLASSTCLPCKNCLNNRCNGTTGECLEGCKQGTYMTTNHCDNICPPFCAGNTCDETNGTCTNGCTPGYHSERCDVSCMFCNGNECYQNGTCVNGCVKGFYGNRCTQSCAGCIDNECNATGVCDKGCKPGYYSLGIYRNCGISCQGCRGKECYPYYGCSETCLPGYYNKFCNSRCNENCFACHRQTGECLVCKSGLTGLFCNETCATGTCVNPFEHVNASKPCQPGYFGVSCTQSCLGYLKHCDSQKSSFNPCNRFTGDCEQGCVSSRYGPKCEHSCRNCLYGCLNNNGTCKLNDCKTGFHGDMCELPCPRNCDMLGCDKQSGVCEYSCREGYFGPYCNLTCPEHCSSKVCNRFTGSCKYGCSLGYTNLPNCTDVATSRHSHLSYNGLSTGAIVGIVMGSLFACCVGIAAMVLLIINLRKGNRIL